MIFKRFFSQTIRVNKFDIDIFPRVNKFGFKTGFNKRIFLNKKNIDYKFKITSMMGLVTISDSIKDALYKSEVIPTVIHDVTFVPKGFLMIQYKDSDKEVTMGNTLKPEDTQSKPEIHFTLNLTDIGSENNGNENANGSDNSIHVSKDDRFTLVLTDPDAPTKGDEKWSEYCHYIVKDIKLNEFGIEPDTTKDNSGSKNSLDSFGEQLTTVNLQGVDVVPYLGPAPPPKTGLHRYVFLLYKQQRAGSTPVELSVPSERACWGSGIPGEGAAEYAKKNSLELYAVNFFYAKNND